MPLKQKSKQKQKQSKPSKYKLINLPSPEERELRLLEKQKEKDERNLIKEQLQLEIDEIELRKQIRHEQSCEAYRRKCEFDLNKKKMEKEKEKIREKWREDDLKLYDEAVEQKAKIIQKKGEFIPKTRDEQIIKKRIHFFGAKCPDKNDVRKLLYSQGMESAFGMNFTIDMMGFEIKFPDKDSYEIIQDGIILTNSEFEGRFIFK